MEMVEAECSLWMEYLSGLMEAGKAKDDWSKMFLASFFTGKNTNNPTQTFSVHNYWILYNFKIF